MKRILFYSILVIQVVVVGVIGWQYYLVEDFGMEIKLLREKPELGKYVPYYEYGNMHVDYEINAIDEDKWEAPDSIHYKEKVYVLLEEGDDGIYHVVRASDKKLEEDSGQVVLKARYRYSADHIKKYYVDYGIEDIRNGEDYRYLDAEKQWIVTVKIAPWGQKRIINIEN